MEVGFPMTGSRVPPNNPNAERTVLGCMMLNADDVMEAQQYLDEQDFYDPIHKELFSAMLHITQNGLKVDLITVDDEMSRRGRLAAIGGTEYLINLMQTVPPTGHVADYVPILQEKSTLRKLIAAAEAILTDSYDGSKEMQEVLENAEKSISDIARRKGAQELTPIQPVLLNTFEQIEKLVKNHGRIEGVPTGYTELDDMTTGLHAGEMVLIAARPSMGKTAFGMNIIENAAIRAGKKAAVFSLEMPAEQLVMRMLCTEARVDMQRVRRGQINDDEWMKLSEAIINIGPAAIFIDATPGVSVSDIRSKARRVQLEHGLDIIMIDYLQLMSGVGRFGSRQEEVSSISRGLKGLATELGVPVIALSQLSRAPTGRTDHRPMLNDIRDSGAIEQDADVVMFIHREEYYGSKGGDEPVDKNVAEIIIAKQRNGALGNVKLGWKGEYTWFMDLSPRAKEAIPLPN